MSQNFDSKVTVIFPAKNEEGTIETAILTAKQSCFTPEILIVDAYSTDKTAELATKSLLSYRSIASPLSERYSAICKSG